MIVGYLMMEAGYRLHLRKVYEYGRLLFTRAIMRPVP